ncbi:MAG: DUF1934 domain-containing protein [Lachnospiraceae bacterium]|nr:DUF1934 domain-containing protein [Lachnospiraceae bacterium]
MTKDVLLTISGLHYDEYSSREDDNEPIEVITPAAYYLKNNKHYIIYEELVEGMPGSIKNKIRITGQEQLEILKSGLSGTHMVFENGKIHMTPYETPYGEMLLGVYTKDLKVEETEDRIDIRISYELDVNGDKVADSEIKMCVKAK